MPVRFFYVDESYDEDRFCLSALSLRHSTWKEAFDMVRTHRQDLRDKHGLFVRKEIHARDFVAGRGRISGDVISKYHRSLIFKSFLDLVAKLPDVQLFNVCLRSRSAPNVEMVAWDRLINRIERTMKEYDEREARPC